jgi:hypothetical protein
MFILSAVVGIAWAGPFPARVDAATVLRPNLKMHRIEDLIVQTVDGRRLLRFTSIMVNLGQGPYEVVGQRSSTTQPMAVSQVLYNSAGGRNGYATPTVMQWAGDGHDHWHVRDAMTYELYPAAGPMTVRRGAKIGFCMIDSTPYSLGLPGAPQSPQYRGSGCSGRTALRVVTGISVGWGDEYPWDFAYQWIDITGLGAGTYLLRATGDQPNHFMETNEYDNCVWARITIQASGSAVPVLERGSDCGRESVTPVDDFPDSFSWSAPRRLSFEAGTYVGVRFNSIGTVLASKTMTLSRASGASTIRRAIPPGQSSHWFYIVDGGLAGYWVRDTGAIDQI